VNGVGILDTPKYERGPDQDPNDFAICRTLQIDPCPHPLRFVLYEEGAGKNKIGYSTFSEKGDGITAVEEDGKIIVEVAPHDKQIIVGACISPLEKDGGHFGFAFTPDLQKSFTHGGPARWGAPIAVEGELSDPVRLAKEKAASDSAAVEHKQRAESLKGNKAAVDEMNEEMSKAKDAEKASEQLAKQIVQANGPYVVDTITLPFKNPYDAWMRVSGFDFFPDGHSAAVCTWNGDVWIVKGIDDKLDHLTWQRYATGLFQSLGLKIVNGEIYVSGRDQITRLHDLNGDGEADWYENFNNDCEVTDGFHEFQHDLQTDSEGNFFIAKGGPVNPGGRGFQKQSEDNGCMMKISPDGKKCEIYATGMRAPNGTSMGPNDMLTVSDNQGTWVPACRISFVTKGSFLGVPDTSHLNPKPDNYGNPIVWFPYVDGDYTQGDNSSGGAAWDTFGKWGPLDGRCIHLSYGTCSIFELMYENVGGVWQGGVCRFPLDFDSGIMRARFNPVDGQLYVAGLKGWQTRGAKDGCFQRVRYTGKPVHMPTELHVLKGAISITFTSPVDPVSAVDPDNYSIEWWNMIWSSDYGSPDVLRDNPKKKGHDTVDIAGITISDDHKTVTIKIDDLKPVMLMKTIMKIKAADGSPMNWELDNTVNVVPGGPSIAVKQPAGK
jgi:glucose/arabinose dehydrogenase